MKRSWKMVSGCRFTLVFVLLLATAAWTVPVSVANEPAARLSGQTVTRPLPASGPFAAKPMQAAGSLPVLLRQLAAATAHKHSAEAEKKPVEVSAIVNKTSKLLASPKFTFLPDKAIDPFVPFVSLQPANENGGPGTAGFLTPLQKMTLTEIETGLKAIASGGLGRMAVIEDSTGKGYIVNAGTPAGPNDGVITQIQDNSLVVREAVWNSQTRQRVPTDFTVKMVRKSDQPF